MLATQTLAAEIPAFGRTGDRYARAALSAGRAPFPAAVEAGFCPAACARWARGEGLGAGDTVALLTRDAIRAAPLRLGLDRAGIRVVSLDAGQRGDALAASLSASGARVVIADTALAEAYAGVMGRLATYPAVWWNGPGADFARFDLALTEADDAAA